MFQLIGFLVALATFPGVVVHEVAHLFFCRRAGLRVYDFSLLRLGNPVGYVIHESPTRLRDALAITVAPLLINSVGAVLVAWFSVHVAVSIALQLGPSLGRSAFALVGIVGMWLTVSLAMHSFPSFGDAKSLWAQVSTGRHGVSGWLLGAPVAGLVVLGSAASFVWLDAVWGVFLFYIVSAAALEFADAVGRNGFVVVQLLDVGVVGAFCLWVVRNAFSRQTLMKGASTAVRVQVPPVGD